MSQVEEFRLTALEKMRPHRDKIELTAELLIQKVKLGLATENESISALVYCYVAGCLSVKPEDK